MSDETPEMRAFYLHREVALSLVDMAYLYSRGERPSFGDLASYVIRRRGQEAEQLERMVLLLNHLKCAAYGKDGIQPDDVEDWFAAADPIEVVFALGAAATRAANVSADNAQQHAINLENA